MCQLRSPREPVLDTTGAVMVLLLGSYIGIGTLWVFHHYLELPGERAQTMAFAGLILAEMLTVFNFRALHAPLPVIGLFTNPWLMATWVMKLIPERRLKTGLPDTFP